MAGRWATVPRLKPWATVGGKCLGDFVRRSAAEPSMRPRVIVPFYGREKVLQERSSPIGHIGQAGEQALDRQNDSFHHGNRALFTDGSVARAFDSFAFAPFSEGFAVEMFATIADDVLRRFACLCNGASQEA